MCFVILLYPAIYGIKFKMAMLAIQVANVEGKEERSVFWKGLGK